MYRLAMPLKVILRRKALYSSTSGLTAEERLGVLKMMFSAIVSSGRVYLALVSHTVHQTDSSAPCHRLGKVAPSTLFWPLCE